MQPEEVGVVDEGQRLDGSIANKLDRKQEIHEGVPPGGVFSAGLTSCESYLSLIPGYIYTYLMISTSFILNVYEYGTLSEGDHLIT